MTPDEKNRFEIALSQACLGKISNNVRMITFQPSSERFVMRFVLEKDEMEDRWAIREIAEEFDALIEAEIRNEIIIEVYSGELHFPHDGLQRTVYRRKEVAIANPDQ